MNARVQTYLTEQLAFTGLALLHYEMAWRMRPDLWTSLASAREDLTDAGPKLTSFIEERAGARLFEVRFGGDRRISVIAFTSDKLAERVTWLTGFKVLGVQLAALGKVIHLQGG